MPSDRMERCFKKAPQRGLFLAMGYTRNELYRPVIGTANSGNQIIPNHIHLNRSLSGRFGIGGINMPWKWLPITETLPIFPCFT